MPRAKRIIECAECGAQSLVERIGTRYCLACYPKIVARARVEKHRAKLLAFFNSATPDVCLTWPGSKNNKGYGYVSLDNHNKIASRVAHEMVIGPIHKGLVVMHSCDNPSCVNHHHLSAGTQKENIADAFRKGRKTGCGKPGTPRHAVKGEKNPSAKLTEAQVIAIKASPNVKRKDLAEKFGVSIPTIAFIRNGRIWSHIQ